MYYNIIYILSCQGNNQKSLSKKKYLQIIPDCVILMTISEYDTNNRLEMYNDFEVTYDMDGNMVSNSESVFENK